MLGGIQLSIDVTKRNHYLPQFYLHNFVQNNEKGIFWVYYKGEKEPQPQTPVNTGVEKHLYNLKKSDGSIDDNLEKNLFSPIEGDVSPIIKKLIDTKARLQDKDIERLAPFMALMATRIPRSIQMVRELGEAMLNYMLKDLANQPDEIQKLLDKSRREGEVEYDMTVDDVQNLLNGIGSRFKIALNKKFATGLC